MWRAIARLIGVPALVITAADASGAAAPVRPVLAVRLVNLDAALVDHLGMAQAVVEGLLPANAHARQGIMQPLWHARALPPYAPGVPGFLPAQAQVLRSRVADPGAVARSARAH